MADEFTPYTPPVVMASDTIDGQSGTFSRIGDALTKGVGSAAVSGSLSIYNTFLDYAGKEALDTGQVIRDYDAEWGNYYEDNKETIDFAGFVGTSFVPGMIGVKALRLAQGGEALGAIGRVLSLTSSKKNHYFEQAMRELAKSGGSITSQVTSAKRAQLAWALADQTLVSAAAELAIVATMNDSPIFEGADAGDFAKNVAIGALFGGVIGGVLEHAGTRGILKQAQLKIEGNRRLFDTIFDPIKMGLSKSDETLLFAEDIIRLPDDFFSTNFSYTVSGTRKNFVLDTSEAFKAVRTRAEKVATDTLALKFNELAEGGEITGQAMFKFIVDKVKSGRTAGKEADAIVDEIQGYLQNVKRVTNLTEESGAGAAAPKQFFVNNKPTGFKDIFTEVRGKNTSKQAYYLKTGDPSQIKMASALTGFDTAEEAFEAGFDAMFTKAGKMAINPKSTVIGRTPDKALNNKFFLDLETGSLSPDVILTGADLMKRGSDFQHFPDAIRIGKKEFKQAASVSGNLATSALEASTRFMWASKLDDAAFKGRIISWDDFALLDRAKALPLEFRNSDLVKIKLADGREISFSELATIPEYVNRLKLEWLQESLGKQIKGYDLRELSAHTGTSREWLEEAISTNFATSKQLLGESRDLNAYFKPQTVQVEWDTRILQAEYSGASVGPNHHTTALLSHEYALKIRTNEGRNAADAVLDDDAARFWDAPQDLAKASSEQGAGASAFGASNADYARQAELWVQDTGKQVALVSQKRRDATIEAIASEINAVRDNVNAGAELGILTTALRRDARKYYLVREEFSGAGRLVDREAVKMAEGGTIDLEDAIAYIKSGSTKENLIRGEYEIKELAVADFLEASGKVNADRVQKQTTLLNATGLGRELDSRAVYVPPVDTRRYPHFAFVIAKERIGAATDVAMITAKNPEQLRQLAANVGEDHDVIFKGDTAKFFKAKGQYDYSLQINETQINSTLQRKGILGDFFPETRAENVLEDYVRWHGNASDNLVRSAVQVKNRQFFGEMGFLSEQFQAASLSAANNAGVLKKAIQDPFGEYTKTALNISKQGEFPLLDSLNEFTDKVGTKAYAALDDLWSTFRGSKGKDLVSLQKANDLMESYGLGSPYKIMEDYLVANEKMPRNLIKESFQKVNFWLATTVLRFDLANSLVNVISTPIMLGTEMASIRKLMKSDPELAGKLSELTNIKIPGQEGGVPGTSRLIGTGFAEFFGKGKDAFIARLESIGVLSDVPRRYHEVIGDLAYRPGRLATDWSRTVDKAIEKGATITGNNFSEQLTRFVSASVMRQLTDPLVAAGKLELKEQNAFISSFVNRVQGNYISSQRPVVFQGTTGAAVGLFQTYSFNVLQQLFRHMENKNTAAMLTFAGLQTSLYGMNGLPFFDAINQHIIGSASGNTGHKDAYSFFPAANKELGDWMLYGTASAFPMFGAKSPALYSRGDINPRHLSIIPINPLDVPAVSASIKLVGSIVGFGKNVVQGADVSSSMLQALEHHGWNRPLAGFAQVLAGQTTTGKGSLISSANDLETTSMLARIPDRLVNFGGVSRIFGARPMDEAVALNNLYRNKTYEAMDRQRIDSLGQAVKTKLAGNQVPDEQEMEDFMHQYTSAGGRIETFSSSIQRWSRDANTSVVNQMAKKLGSSYGRNMQALMGGTPLQDYNTLAVPTPQSELPE